MLYLLVCAVVFALQAVFVTFVHVKLAELYAELLGPPLVITAVTVFVSADATGTLSLAQRWERVLERAWAIIIIDVGLSFVNASGLQTVQAGDALDVVFGFLTLLLSGMLLYAEPFAAIEKDTQTLTIVPFAILRSMMLAWVNMSRVFALLAVQIALDIAVLLAEQGALHAGIDARLWVDLLMQTLLAAPLAALYTVAYLDTVSQEKRTEA
ncbi:MAG TPA: hypothetical protein VKT72_10320 [Candidatus Baltobacteraceae bacterium]|nr:hypothetical protein [Candidatus Baltobacteraceae bacterium]